jgi:hypothetical protein
MKQQGWQQGIAAAALLGWMCSAWGQSVDTSMARAVVDQPLSMAVQVRGFDWPASRLTPECLHIQILQGESGETITPVRVRTIPSGEDGRVLVQISSPQTVTDTVLTGRLSLLCGADYTREFTVLVDPPTASPAPKHLAPPAARPPARRVAAVLPTHPTEATTATHNTTRSDDPVPATAVTVRTLEDAEVQRLVNAVVAVLALTPPRPDPPESTTADSSWQDLREEQRQTRASLAALLARSERSERDVWRDAVLVVGGVLGLSVGLLVLHLVREGRMPRMGAQASVAAHRLRHQRAQVRLDTDPFTGRAHGDAPPATTPAQSGTGIVDWLPPAAQVPAVESGSTPDHAPHPRWPDADFGHPSLDTTHASTELLHELEPHVADSPIGVAVVLERRLQELPGKCPWILLRLLALYRQMAQPWNHDRVAAQMEALYNVRIPDMESAAACTGADLEGYPDTLDKIRQAWSLDDPVATLTGLLLRPTVIEVLDQPAFEDTLLLHAIVRQHQSAWLTAVEGGPSFSATAVAAAAAATPPSTHPASNRLMDLLAA